MNDQFDLIFDCFVVSLKRTPERLRVFRTRNSQCGINFQHCEAIDGEQLDASKVESSIVAKGATDYTAGSIGNAMSHLTLWQRCAGQTKAFVVLEDDAVVRSDIKARLITTTAQLNEWDIILLGYNTDAPLELNIAPGILLGGHFSVFYPNNDQLADFATSTNPVGLHRLHVAMGICGYVISPSGAQSLMRNCFPMDNRLVPYASFSYKFPAYGLDSIMATIYPKIRAYACLAPLVMTANDQSISTIQTISRNAPPAKGAEWSQPITIYLEPKP
jgi:glycosyl transferase, family 25